MRKLVWFSLGVTFAAFVGMYIMSDRWYLIPIGIASICLTISVLLLRRFPVIRPLSVVLLGCIIAFGWIGLFDNLYLITPRTLDGQNVVTSITVTDYSKPTQYGSVSDGMCKLEGRPYKISVFSSDELQLKPGDRITAEIAIKSTLPGASGEYPYSYARGVFLSASIKDSYDVQTSTSIPVYGYPAYMRESVKEIIQTIFSQDTLGFAIALLLGNKDYIDFETDYALKISGISHIVAVSGLHVTILFTIVQTVLLKRRWLSAILGIPVLFFFAAIAGFSPSITRACLMHSLMIIAALFDKEYDSWSALGFAVLAMILFNPWSVSNVSFQLSVLCIAGIQTFSQPIKAWVLDRTPIKEYRGKYKKHISTFASSISVSLGASIAVTPLCAYHFGVVSLVSLLTNLLTLWVISFIFCGIIIACGLALLWLPAAKAVGLAISVPINYVLNSALWISKFPLAALYTDSIFIVFWLVLVYVLIGAICVFGKKYLRLGLLISTITLCICLLASWLVPVMDECRVTVLDVGQGQCILLQSRGKTYVVDCGGDDDETAAETAIKALRSQGIYSIDGLILTHFDRDHVGGVSHFLTQMQPQKIYAPECDLLEQEAEWSIIQTEIYQTVHQMTQIRFQDAVITLVPMKTSLSVNADSLCVLFQTENCDILITGDQDISGEYDLMKMIPLPELEVLVVGHHGSRYSTSDMLLRQTKPEQAIISVGVDNHYGHPADETIERLLAAGCKILRTDQDGTVVYRR